MNLPTGMTLRTPNAVNQRAVRMIKEGLDGGPIHLDGLEAVDLALLATILAGACGAILDAAANNRTHAEQVLTDLFKVNDADYALQLWTLANMVDNDWPNESEQP